MHRCEGGQSQRGDYKSGRLHLHDEGKDCPKHDSDNFSLLSTESRVAARDRQRAIPASRSQSEDRPRSVDAISEVDEGDENAALEDTGLVGSPVSDDPDRFPLPRWNSEVVNSGSSRAASLESSIQDGVRAMNRNLIARLHPAGRMMMPTSAGAVPHQRELEKAGEAVASVPDRALFQFVVFVMVLLLFLFYRWIHRGSFQYQEDVIRGYYGLLGHHGESP